MIVRSEWRTISLRHLVTVHDGKRIPLNAAERGDRIGPYPYWGSGGVVGYVDRPLFHGTLVLLGEDGAPFFDRDRPVAFRIDEPVWVNNHIHVLRPALSMDASFLTYFLNQVDYSLYITGSTRDKLTQEDLRAIAISVPPLDEQRQIAEYLDRETGKIDELIAKQEQLVDRVAERRQTVITETVLRGLDSSAELKASGMDAIGSIPGHWTVSPLKHAISAIEQGVSPEASAELADSESWGVLKSGCVNGGKFSDVEHKRLPDDFDFLPSLAVAVGDLLISRASGSPSLVGSAAIVKHLRYRLILSDKTFRLRAKVGVDVRFIEQFMQSKAYREQVRGAISGAVGLANNLPMSSLKSFQIAIPPLTEQIKIADFLDQKVGQIDLLVAKAKEVTRAISERRAALISAAVTGKIDVRGL